MDWLLIAAFLGWPLMWWFGTRQAKEQAAERTLAMETPPQVEEGRFLVVARTASGARARKMFELGKAGAGEVLELWDGPNCRGRKGPEA